MLKKLISSLRIAKNAAPVRVAASAAIEQLEQRSMLSASPLVLGLGANIVSAGNYDNTVKMLRETGTKAVRLWYGFDSYNTRSEAGIFKYVNRLAADGFDITLTVSPRNGITGNDASVKGFFEFLMDRPGMKNAVDRWEIGNEPDHKQYWQGSLNSYVNDFLQPAADVLHRHGEKVVSAGPSWNPEDVRTMINAGMLNHVDYVGYHPYRNSVTDLKLRIAQVKAMVGDKPLVATEWNVRGSESNPTEWAKEIAEFWPVIRDNFHVAHYYAAYKSGTMAGGSGVLTSTGAPNGPFYTTVKNFQYNMGSGSGSVGGSPIVGTPSTDAPVVNSVSMIDAASDTVMTGFNSLEDGQVIDLAKLPSRSINFVANSSASTDSVKFTFNGTTRVESSKPLTAFGDNGRGDYYGQTLTPGAYTLTTQAFSDDNATGTAGAVQKFSVTVIDSGNTASGTTIKPAVRGFAIIDAKTGLALSGYSNVTASTSIRLSSLPTRNIQILALANSSTGSVKLSWTGRSTRIENNAPYQLFANSSNVATSWYATAGTYGLKATAYGSDRATGTVGNTLGVTLKFY